MTAVMPTVATGNTTTGTFNTTVVPTASTIVEPTILSANTYFWTPGASADQRRRAEERRQSEVASYLTALGFTVKRSGDNVSAVHASGVEVSFSYNETCKNVYKSLSVCRVTKNGTKNSNISAIRKIANALTA